MLLNWITVQLNPREASHRLSCQTILLILKVVMEFRLTLQSLLIMASLVLYSSLSIITLFFVYFFLKFCFFYLDGIM